jgi:hypothetical protein
MSAKRLLPLGILLVVLVIAAVVLKRQPAPTRLAEETGFERLVPHSLRPDSIRGVDFSLGVKPEEVLRLRRQDGTWVAASYYNAPVQGDKMSKFLQAITALEGELRAEQSDLLKDFQLDDSQALHVRLYTEQPDTPALHLLAGKGSGRNSFVRLANATRVYSVNVNIQSEAGLSGSAPEQSLQAKPWLHLQIQDVPKEQITALEIHTPQRSFHFAAQPGTTPPAAGEAAAPPPATPQWRLSAPQVPFPVRQSGLDGLLSTLRTLRADDIADPSHATDYGLETPEYRVVMTVQAANQEAQPVALLFGHTLPDSGGKRYARLGRQGPIYVVPAWSVNRLFPPAKDLLELPRPVEHAEDIQRVAWQQGDASWTLEENAAEENATAPQATTDTPSGRTWHLVEAPETPLEEPAVQAVLEAITQLTIEDWVEQPGSATGLEQPQLVLQVTLQNGQGTYLSVGAARGNADEGQYVRLAEAPGTFVLSASTYKTLTEALAALRPVR